MTRQFLQNKICLSEMCFLPRQKRFIFFSKFKSIGASKLGALGVLFIGMTVSFGTQSWGKTVDVSIEETAADSVGGPDGISGSIAGSHVVTVVGRGAASGFCTEQLSTFCIENIERSAKSNGQNEADMQCRLQQGRSITYTSHCFTSCSPMYIPPGPGQTYVSCNANCDMQCEL